MSNLHQAIQDAQLNYVKGTVTNQFSGEVIELQASKSSEMCACRGKCGKHTGPCTMQAGKGKIGMCNACSMAMKAEKTKSKTTDGPMKPLKDKKPKKETVKTIQAPDDLGREKGKAPDKNGKIIS